MYVAYVETRDIIQNVFVEVCSRENASTDQISLFVLVFVPLDTFHDDKKRKKKKKKKRSRFKEEYLKKKDSTSQNSLQVLTKMYVTYVKTRDVIQNVFVEIYSRENVSTDQRSLFAFVFTPLDTLHDDFLSSTPKSVFF